MFNFSIIIPHKDSANLLQRLLKSIPNDELIQVLVVDDDSSIDEFKRLQELQNKYVFELYQNTYKFAGGARNVGIEHAKGKWLLFADSDDFFVPGAFEAFDDYVNSKFDIVFFNVNSCFSTDYSKSYRDRHIKTILRKAESEKCNDILRCSYNVPWGKMIKAQLIKDKSIKFEEIIAGNDMMFSVKSGIYANDITFDMREIYCVTVTEHSITTTLSLSRFESKFQATLRVNDFLRQYNYHKYQVSVLYFIGKSYQFGGRYFFHVIKECFHHKSNMAKGLGKIFRLKRVLMDRQNTKCFKGQ